MNTVSFDRVLNGLRHTGSIAIRVFLAAVFFSAAAPVMARDITIAWDPNQETDLDGYAVYYARHSPGPPYDFVGDLPLSTLPDPEQPTTDITNLEEDVNYYFALTAYDTEGNESSFSQDLCVRVGETIQECAPAGVSSSISSSSSGGSGSGPFAACYIQAAGGSSKSAGHSAIPAIVWGITFVLGIILPAACHKRE
jgi:hypothetical protein